jgi:hypothetical protein
VILKIGSFTKDKSGLSLQIIKLHNWKIIQTLPLSCFHQFTNLAFHEVTLEYAEVIDV